MMRSFIKSRLSVTASSSAFIARSVWCGKRILPFRPAQFGNFTVQPLCRKDLGALESFYASLHDGGHLGFSRMALLWMTGSRLCLVAKHGGTDDLAGMAMYYFNARDRAEETVHEGYLGLRETAVGQGLDSFIRSHALENFAASGLSAVSIRITTADRPLLNSVLRLGFVPIETYFDPAMEQERHYLVCDLRRRRNQAGAPQSQQREESR